MCEGRDGMGWGGVGGVFVGIGWDLRTDRV